MMSPAKRRPVQTPPPVADAPETMEGTPTQTAVPKKISRARARPAKPALAAEAAAKTRPYPGALIVVEGVDGSGKSTQLYLLKRWLEIEGYRVHFTEWNSSPLVKSATKRAKKERVLTPITYSLIHAADFGDRCERQILPLLQRGYLVLADRYIYTAFARDSARGCPEPWLRNLYGFAPIPDLTFYFRAPLEICLDRILKGRPRLKFYEAGMDLRLSIDPYESFRRFQGMIMEQYDLMTKPDDFIVMDSTKPVDALQRSMRDIVSACMDLNRFRGHK